jgi:hypothetical protein
MKLLWKALWRVLKKLKIELLYDALISLLGISPKECRPAYNRHLVEIFCQSKQRKKKHAT